MASRTKPAKQLLLLFLLLLGSTMACAGQAAPDSDATALNHLDEGGEVIAALDTDRLLELVYNHPREAVTVEGVVVRTHYAERSTGQPTFLDFHDPYEGYFKCVIWEEDTQTGEPTRSRFIEAFPPNPETYFLNERVRVTGSIAVYRGDPEIVLHSPSQIWLYRNGVHEDTALVTRVIDGDTIELQGGVKVRYIGIDAPEADEPYCAEATEANCRLVEGREVRMEGDVEAEDAYGRLLRYVWVDGTMVNAELISLGCAYSYSRPPNLRYQVQFLQLEREAREQKRGLWSQ